MKTHHRPQIFMHRFQLSTKHLEQVTTIRKQYMFLQKVEKKETTRPSRKQEKNALKNQVIFHQSAKSRLFLPNPQNIMFVRTNHSQKPAEKIHCLGIPDHTRV